jgi:hypothetical protein
MVSRDLEGVASMRKTCQKDIGRVGQIRIYAPYMTVNLVISLPEIPNIHRI